MVKRRSFKEGLSADQEAFLNQKTATTKQPATPKPQKRKENPPMSKVAIKETVTPNTSPPVNNPSQYSLVGTSSINARIDPLITTALLRAALERRLSGLTPSTQRDIIAEALSEWLKKHGYLNF